MGKRGRPVVSKSVPSERDRKVCAWVVRCAYEAANQGHELALRDRLDAAGHRAKAPSKSVYKLAQETLRKAENIHLGVDSIEKIWKKYKHEYSNDLTYHANRMGSYRRVQKGRESPPEAFVPKGDAPDESADSSEVLDSSEVRPRIAPR